MSSITGSFTREDVVQWESGLQRWCIFEVLLCLGVITAINVFEIQYGKQRISGYPKGSTKEINQHNKGKKYKESQKSDSNDPNKNEENSNEPKTKDGQDLGPQSNISTPGVNLEVSGMDEVNDFDFIHQLWLYLLIHCICLGSSFHKYYQSSWVILWGFLHALTFCGFVFAHVSNLFHSSIF